jgi:LysR family transcriptional regulator for metE and metH
VLEIGELDEHPRRLIEERVLFADEVVFVLSASHPLAAKAALTPRDFRGQTLLTSHLPTRHSTWFTDPVSARGRETLHYQYLPLTEAILDFARAGMGIGVLSEWMAAAHLRRGDLVAKRLASGRLERPWRIAWRKEVGDAAARLTDVLRGLVPKGDGWS